MAPVSSTPTSDSVAPTDAAGAVPCARPAPPAAGTPPLLRLRIPSDNPNHHLWNNHGTWYLHYTVHPTPFTKHRVRRSLGTSHLAVARERRDAFFVHGRLESRPAGQEAVA